MATDTKELTVGTSLGEQCQAIDWPVSDTEYHADTTALGSTGLRCFIRNRAEFAARYVLGTAEPEPPSDDLELGILAHEMVANPNWRDGITLYTETKSRDTVKFRAFVAEHQGERIYMPHELAEVERIASAIMADPLTARLMGNARTVIREQAIRWQDPGTGLWLKCKPDGLDLSIPIAADLKTTKAVTDYSWSKAIGERLYHCQAALYVDGIKARHGVECIWGFVVAEKGDFGRAFLSTLPSRAIDLGRRENEVALDQLATCLERHKNGDPHAWNDPMRGQRREIDLPNYYYPRG